jgi:hypothetical protein
MLIPLGFLAGSGGVEGDYELISTTILGSSTPSITFDVSSFASTYKHLQIRASMRTDRAGTTDRANIRFNGDTGANYSGHVLYANSTQVLSAAEANGTFVGGGYATGNTATSNAFAASVVDFLDVFSTTKNKTTRDLSTDITGSRTEIELGSGNWRNTAAVTSILVYPQIASNFLTGSRFSLYGIRG